MGVPMLSIPKQINGGMFVLNVENMLHHTKSPKIIVSIVNPSKDNTGKNQFEKAFLDVKEAFALVRNIRNVNQADPKQVLVSYKGGVDKKRDNMLVSRILRFERNMEKKTIVITLSVSEGEQDYTVNKYGEQVKGVVKPKRGGTQLGRVSISLTRDEALYVADMIDKELSAWRVAINCDVFFHPDKYSQPQQPNV